MRKKFDFRVPLNPIPAVILISGKGKDIYATVICKKIITKKDSQIYSCLNPSIGLATAVLKHWSPMIANDRMQSVIKTTK